jgi:hypothetical protein
MTTIKPSQSTASYDSIKLGIDAHAQYYWVSRQVDGATGNDWQNWTELGLEGKRVGHQWRWLSVVTQS